MRRKMQSYIINEKVRKKWKKSFIIVIVILDFKCYYVINTFAHLSRTYRETKKEVCV